MADGYAIVLTVNDKIKIVKYYDFDDIKETTKMDTAQLCCDNKICAVGGLKYRMYCDEEGLLHETKGHNKVNALVSVMFTNEPIYGDCFILKSGRENDYGFTEKEAKLFVNLIEKVKENVEHGINFSKERLTFEEYHQKYDDNKPEPKISFMTFDSFDDIER